MTMSLGIITPEITRLDLNGLGGMSDTQATQIGHSLIGQSYMNIQAALAPFSGEDRQKIIVAYLAAGGSPSALQMAQSGVSLAKVSPSVKIAWGVLGTLSMAASAYHGYKRNRSVGWALWWGLMGGLFPIITPTIGIAQGFGKRRR